MPPSARCARPFALQRFDSLDSTSLYVRREIAAGRVRPEQGPQVVVAAVQTGGVGRLGRAWSSPRGGLWASLAVPLGAAVTATAADLLGLRVGAACLKSVRDLLPIDARSRLRLKWPNDLVIDGRKVLGVLTEIVNANGAAWVLVGVGLNANLTETDLPAELRGQATTLRSALGVNVDLDAALADFVTRLHQSITNPCPRLETLEFVRENLAGLGETARFTRPDGTRVEGRLIGIDEHGCVLVDRDGGVETIAAVI